MGHGSRAEGLSPVLVIDMQADDRALLLSISFMCSIIVACGIQFSDVQSSSQANYKQTLGVSSGILVAVPQIVLLPISNLFPEKVLWPIVIT